MARISLRKMQHDIAVLGREPHEPYALPMPAPFEEAKRKKARPRPAKTRAKKLSGGN